MSKNEIDSIAFLILAWFAGLVILGMASDIVKDAFFSSHRQSKIKDKIYDILGYSTKFCFWTAVAIVVACIVLAVVAATVNAFKVLT